MTRFAYAECDKCADTERMDDGLNRPRRWAELKILATGQPPLRADLCSGCLAGLQLEIDFRRTEVTA